MPGNRAAAFVLALAALLTGCRSGLIGGGSPSATRGPSTATAPSPPVDRPGPEDGMVYGDTLHVAFADGIDGVEVRDHWYTPWEPVESPIRFAEAAAEAEFRDGATDMFVRAHDAVQVADGIYVIDGGPFADAFQGTDEDDVFTVVNAPNQAGLDDIYRWEGGGS